MHMTIGDVVFLTLLQKVIIQYQEHHLFKLEKDENWFQIEELEPKLLPELKRIRNNKRN